MKNSEQLISNLIERDEQRDRAIIPSYDEETKKEFVTIQENKSWYKAILTTAKMAGIVIDYVESFISANYAPKWRIPKKNSKNS